MSGSDGARLGGRYELAELLGRGGMAEVRRATDVRLGRVVAVKRLRTDLATDPTFQARFRREAQAAAGLNHPNIVAVYDTGEEMASDGSHVQPYIVMEYVEGRTLREVLNEGRKLLPERALEIVTGVLAALDYSHRAGIIHRDIKPANVMVTPTGEVKVMDFGIARAISDGTSSVTQTSAVVGTAQYLSPEQARGETVDGRSDVYSTGCLLYELLTGRPPFVGDSPFSVAYQHVREVPDPPSVHNAELPRELDAIVMKSLAKSVDERYASAAAFAADIQRYLKGQPISAPAPVVVAAPVAATAAEQTSLFNTPVDDYDEQETKRWPIIVLVLVLLALLGGGAIFGMKLFGDANDSVTVPSLTNMTQKEATARLEQEGLELGAITRVNSDDVPKGRVVSQSPSAGRSVEAGSEVDVDVSAGRSTVVVPFVVGQSKADATQALTSLGLNVEFTYQDSAEPRDQVLATNPNAASEIPAGNTVQVTLSSGPAEVPNVVGMSESRATSTLQAAGFRVNAVDDNSSSAARGTVTRQSPEGLSQAVKGSSVTIYVSTFEPQPPPSPTPTPSDTATPTPTPTPDVEEDDEGFEVP